MTSPQKPIIIAPASRTYAVMLGAFSIPLLFVLYLAFRRGFSADVLPFFLGAMIPPTLISSMLYSTRIVADESGLIFNRPFSPKLQMPWRNVQKVRHFRGIRSHELDGPLSHIRIEGADGKVDISARMYNSRKMEMLLSVIREKASAAKFESGLL